MTTPRELMLRSALSRIDYWTGRAEQARSVRDSEREALCRRSADEYNALIESMALRSAGSGSSGDPAEA